MEEVQAQLEIETVDGKQIIRRCLNPETATYVTIPSTIAGIGDSAFAFCTQIESIHIPDSVETIGKFCFDNCTALRKVHLPDTLKIIDVHTFLECINLTDINLPQSLEAIEELAFGKTGLMKVIIPEGVKRLGSHAFALCKHLEEVTIPNSVEKIVDDVFIYNNRLRTIYIPQGTTPWFEVMLEGHEEQFVEQENSVTRTPEQN